MGAIVTRAIATVGTLKIMAFVGATVSMVCLSISLDGTNDGQTKFKHS